ALRIHDDAVGRRQSALRTACCGRELARRIQSDPVGYLSQLYAERVEEAARFEASGNALAASRARDAQSEALRLLNQISPEPNDSPEPSASTVITLPSPSPTPDATAVASASPSPATPRPTIVRTP